MPASIAGISFALCAVNCFNIYMKKRVRTKLYVLYGAGAISLAVLCYGLLSQFGFVVSGFSIVRGATISITNSLPNSSIYVDKRRISSIHKSGVAKIDGLTPKKHSIIVSRADVWPWIITTTPSKGERITFHPTQVTRTPKVVELNKEKDAERIQTASHLINNYREPTRSTPLIKNDKKIWVEGVTIYEQYKDTQKKVFTAKTPIRSINWYNDTDTAIIISAQDTVAVIDIQGDSVENFFPLYKGTSPKATPSPDTKRLLFIQDGDKFFTLSY